MRIAGKVLSQELLTDFMSYPFENSQKKMVLILAPRPTQIRPSSRQNDSLFLCSFLKNHMQTERQRILKGFNEMRCILDSLEQKELQKLEEDEVNVLENLVAAKDQLVQQSQYMRELISDLERQMWGSSIDTLRVRFRMELLHVRFSGKHRGLTFLLFWVPVLSSSW